LGDVGDHVQVTRGAAAQTGLALAGELDPRALAHAGRDVDPVALHLAQPALAGAGRARILDHGAGAVAAAARAGDGEHALALGLDAAAVADRADLRRGARAGTAPAAGRARGMGRHGHGHLRALGRLFEGQRDRGLEVLAAL